ncbi:MAG: hypothetical protein AB1714_27745 [Acidobacteriota bacterium]
MNRPVVRSIASLAFALCVGATCMAQSPCIVDLKTPRAGDRLKILDTVTIRFAAISPRGVVWLYLAKGSGEHRRVLGEIACVPAIGGRYDWTVGQYSASNGKAIAVTGDDYSIVASVVGCSDSSGQFTISPRIDVRSPNGGEQWLMGSVHGIRIDYFDGRSCITLEPTKDPWSMPVTVDLTLLAGDGRAFCIDRDYRSTIECPGLPFSPRLWPGLTYSWSVGSLCDAYMDHGGTGFRIMARVTLFAVYPNEPLVLEDESDETFSICDFMSGGLCGFIHIVPGE